MNKYKKFSREVGRREKMDLQERTKNISANAKKQYKN